MKPAYEKSVKKWNTKIDLARNEKLLTEDLLFQLYFQTTYDVWYLTHNRFREDRTGVSEEDFDGVLEYYNAFVTPICIVLREDFNLNPSASDDEGRKKFMKWHSEQKQKLEGDTQESRDLNSEIKKQWQEIEKLS
jgi:hypothetical protein